MKEEIQCAAKFLGSILRRGTHSSQADLFCDKLCEILAQHYEQHWHPNTPSRGSGYRCIRINHQLDPLLIEPAKVAGLDQPVVLRLLPCELTLWIDPMDVSYRIGEEGSICNLKVKKPVEQVEEFKMVPVPTTPVSSLFRERAYSPPMVMRKRSPPSPETPPRRARKNIFRAGPRSPSASRPRPVISSMYSSRLVSSVVS